MRNLIDTPARLFRTTSAAIVFVMAFLATGVWLLLALFTAGDEAPGAVLAISTVSLLFLLATAVYGLTRNSTVPLAAGLLLLVPMLSVLIEDGDELFGVLMAGITMAPATALIIALCVATCLEGGPWRRPAQERVRRPHDQQQQHWR